MDSYIARLAGQHMAQWHPGHAPAFWDDALGHLHCGLCEPEPEPPIDLDHAWTTAWAAEHAWDGGRHTIPWGPSMVPPRPATWQPGEPTHRAWLQQVVPQS